MSNWVPLEKIGREIMEQALTSVEKGKIGELAVQKLLLSRGYSCYGPIVDVKHVDLIVELPTGMFSRVQIKTVFRANRKTSIEVKLKKYSTDSIDVLAIYYVPEDICAFVPYSNQDSIILAVSAAKNNQKHNRDWIWQYQEFPDFIPRKKDGK